MKISHRLLLMVVITGLGYLGITLSFNQFFSEALRKNELLSDIQAIHNGLKLVRLEIRLETPRHGREKTIGSFTEETVDSLQRLASQLPSSLIPQATGISRQLQAFDEAFKANQNHGGNLKTLIKRFKDQAQDLTTTLIKQSKALEPRLGENNRINSLYKGLQHLGLLIGRYSGAVTEALMIDKNIPVFQANRYLLENNFEQTLDRIKQQDPLLPTFNALLFAQQVDSWFELSQRIAIELQQQQDSSLKLNIVEEKITKALIKLEDQLKHFIDANVKKTGSQYKYATISLLVLMLLITIIISRSIFIPLKRLLAFSHELASGNLDAHLSGLPQGEFQEITDAFNQMADNIKANKDELEDKVRVRTQQLQESNRTLTEEVSARKKVESILHDLATAVLPKTGEIYFSALTRYLTTKMGYDFALIGRLVIRDGQRHIQTLSFSEHGTELPEMLYPVENAPCKLVLDEKRYFFPDDIQTLFPEDSFLKDNSLKGYVGLPVTNKKGTPLGLVTVVSRSPISSPEPVLSILQILVRQVGAEIQRTDQDTALKISEERNRMLVEYAPEAIVIFSPDTNRFVSANRNAARLFGASKAKLYELSPADVSPVTQPNGVESEVLIRQLISDTIAGKHPVFEWRHQTVDGRLIDCEIRLDRFPSEDAILIRGSITDITERKRTEAEMRKLSSALAQAGDAAIVTDPQGVIEYVNYACERITGYTREELVGETPGILKSGRMEPEFYRKLWRTIEQGKGFSDIFINKRKDGSIYYEEKTITPLLNDNREIINYISTGKDITERIQTEERLHHLAYHDPLTDLPNRLMLLERIEHAIDNSTRHHHRLAILFLDLDRFKNINDTLGHDVGDALLREMSHRIGKIVRNTDTFSRFGGDEFAILVEAIEDSNEVAVVAGKILKSLAMPFVVEGHELFTTVSIGISLFPENGENATTLVKNADVAMYRAKEQGRNCYQFYSRELTAKAYERLSIENKLRRALENDEFELFYQPQILRPSNIVYGLEALLRWRDPERGLISPAEFIPVLEETGMIIPVGEWVIETACRDLKQWHKLSSLPLIMSVNLSGKQFEDSLLAEKVIRIVEACAVDPKLLKLEITESALMVDPYRSVRLLKSLSEQGIRFAIDDFGTGYSSLSYLKQFPISTLKIDRSFVKDITVDPDDAAIVNAIIALAKNLNLDVIAEGVENVSQVKYLEQFECERIQGFLYSRPLARNECFRFLADNQGIIEPEGLKSE
ncbi:MAG: EAL domain-containing protein [Ketobacteraceae bacterium]|nr:EAL domain-containing protein [Ketobacteraceae bacterium]